MARQRCKGQAALVAYSAAVLRQISVACIPGSWSDRYPEGMRRACSRAPKKSVLESQCTYWPNKWLASACLTEIIKTQQSCVAKACATTSPPQCLSIYLQM